MESIAGGLTLSRFLDTHLLLCCRNGREWYDVRALIVDDVRRQVERIRQRRNGDDRPDGDT